MRLVADRLVIEVASERVLKRLNEGHELGAF
jgi:hypothetical protein